MSVIYVESGYFMVICLFGFSFVMDKYLKEIRTMFEEI